MGLGLVVALATRDVTAAPPIELRWAAPEGCPARDDVMRELEAALADSDVAEELVVDATVTAPTDQPEWQLQLVFSGVGTGERRLEGESCEALAKSAVLVIAIVYDPLFVPPMPSPAPPVVPPPPPPAPPTAAPTLPPPAPTPPPPWPPPVVVPAPRPPPVLVTPYRPRPPGPPRPRLGVRASALGTLGPLPRAALGFEGGFVVRWPQVTLMARAAYMPPVRKRLQARPDAGGDIDLWTVGAQGCGTVWSAGPAPPALGSYGVRLCGAFDAGQMRAEGFGVEAPDAGSAVWLAPEASAALDVYVLPWLLFDLDFGLGVPILRPAFVLDNVGDVHQPGPVVGRLSLGAEAVF